MFKDLKVVKIISLLILAVVIVLNQVNEHKNTEFIFKGLSYDSQDTLSFLVASNSSSQKHKIRIENITSEEVILDSVLSIGKTYDYFDKRDFLTTGYPVENKLINGLSLSPGIYLANNVNPFVVSGKGNSDVTVVFPIANDLFYTDEEGKRIFESDSSYISMNRPLEMNVWSKGMISFFRRIEKKYNVNYVTDLDLETPFFFKSTRLIVLYGNLTFWTPKMLKNIELFIANGGNLFIISSDVFYAKFCLNQNELEVSSCNEFKSTLGAKIESWNNDSDEDNFLEMRYAFHSNFGGENIERTGVEIKQNAHPIFKNIDLLNLSKILDVGEHYLGVSNTNKSLEVNEVSVIAETNCKRKEDSTMVGGVFEFKKIEGGKAIILGTSDLCLKEQQDEDELSKLFDNIMSYLLSE